jgi:hypothetical protein
VCSCHVYSLSIDFEVKERMERRMRWCQKAHFANFHLGRMHFWNTMDLGVSQNPYFSKKHATVANCFTHLLFLFDNNPVLFYSILQTLEQLF